MRKVKRVMACALAAIMIMSLAACGSSSSDSSSSSTTAAAAAEAGEAGEAAEETVAAAPEAGEGMEVSTHPWYRGEYLVYKAPGESTIVKNTPEDTLVYGNSAGIQAADPNAVQDEYCWSKHVYDTLIVRDATGESDYIPGLATEWGYDDDGNFNITLREGVKFHDGTTLDADDVLFTLERVSKSYQNKCATSMKGIDFDKSYADDDLHLTLVFKNPVGSLVDDLSSGYCGIMSKEFCEENPDATFYDCDAGSGPYMMSETVTGVSQTLERFDDYWGEQGDFKYVIYKLYKDYSVEAIDFLNGDLDIAMNINESTLQEFLDGEYPGTTLYDVPSRSVYLDIATRGDVVMADQRVRQAFAHCIDYEALVVGVYNNDTMGDATHSFLVPGTKYEIDLGVITYDPDLSRSLLEEAGYSMSNPCPVKLVTTNSPASEAAANIIQAYGAAVGFDISIDEIDSSGASAIKNSTDVPAEYDMEIMTNAYNTGSPETLLEGRTMYDYAPEEVSALVGIEDEKFNELAQTAAQSTDEDVRAEAYAEMQELFYDNFWTIQVFSINSMNLVQEYLDEVLFTSGYHPQLNTLRYAE